MVHSTSSTSLSQGFNPYVFSSVSSKEKDPVLRKSDTEDFLDIEALINVNEHALLTLTGFFEGSKILKRLSYTLIPAKNYSEDRVILKFALADNFVGHFPLLRGLFGFGKAAHVVVDADSTDKTFVIEVSSGYAESVIPYFEKIFSWLTKEVKFKSALKQVIQLQKEVKRSQQEAFEALYAA